MLVNNYLDLYGLSPNTFQQLDRIHQINSYCHQLTIFWENRGWCTVTGTPSLKLSKQMVKLLDVKLQTYPIPQSYSYKFLVVITASYRERERERINNHLPRRQNIDLFIQQNELVTNGENHYKTPLHIHVSTQNENVGINQLLSLIYPVVIRTANYSFDLFHSFQAFHL